MMIKIAPSLLSANFSELGADVEKITRAGADMLHWDVMDGHFVPNITFGATVIKSVKTKTHLPFDIHLMISHPCQFIEAFVSAGADSISFHIEADDSTYQTIELIKRYNLSVGIAINPDTPIKMIMPFLSLVDMVVVMTVYPGFGGQSFIPTVIPKIGQLYEEIHCQKLPVEIEVDGGINLTNVKMLIDAGAKIVVAGSFVFTHPSPEEAISQLRLPGYTEVRSYTKKQLYKI